MNVPWKSGSPLYTTSVKGFTVWIMKFGTGNHVMVVFIALTKKTNNLLCLKNLKMVQLDSVDFLSDRTLARML